MQDITQVGTIPARIEHFPSSHVNKVTQNSADATATTDGLVVTVREGDPIELPCVGVGLPVPTYRYGILTLDI